ncbi:MAG: STAS domain-containing protein [Oscillospiraceae bacterium]|jgi:stage II sporulation protein AA (anti-sigma F factor antagonist)|nr:STAS domain-containing protein [Oscillospiraceae bacterium]
MKTDASFDDGILTLSFCGELDHHAARAAVRELERAVETYLPSACVLELAGLTFMDSSGIAVILRALRRMKELGGSMRVAGACGQPLRVITAAGIGGIVDIDALAV